MRSTKDLSTYIRMLCGNASHRDIITVEHRSGNPKRDFLFVNKKQCKHIPNSPTEMLNMCEELANNVKKRLNITDKVLLVGFAETATAIANVLAENIPQVQYVVHTTREQVANSEQLLTFEEEHSHATTQYLLTYADDKLDVSNFNYVLFVDDEISTGNTILNFIKAFENTTDKKFKFGVASICNWQNTENINKFDELSIDRFMLISGTLSDANVIMDTRSRKLGEPSVEVINLHKENENENEAIFNRERLGYKKSDMLGDNFTEVLKTVASNVKGSVRIVGTEEFMYIPIRIGAELEKVGHRVICHSTSRSKIDILELSSFDGTSSGIKKRYEVVSPYDVNRTTYIYNLNEFTDSVAVITDSLNDEAFELFKTNMIKNLKNYTNKIVFVRI